MPSCGLPAPLAAGLRRPWEKPTEPNKLGRPAGSKNRHTAIRHDLVRVLATGEAFSRPAHRKKGTKPRRVRTALPDETPMTG
jgi:hypothetical protein